MNTRDSLPAGLERGERAPDFVLPGPTSRHIRFYGIAGGRPMALVLGRNGDPLDEVVHLAEGLGESPDGPPPVVAVFPHIPGAMPPDPPFPVLVDTEGEVRKSYRVPPDEETLVFVLDENLRVLESFPLESGVTAAKRVQDIVEARLPAPAVNIVSQAPVLLIPDALDPATCRRLIEVFETRGSVETGVEYSSDGQRVGGLDPDAKRRRDHTVIDPDLLRQLTQAVGRRVIPEVRKAFSFRATRFEGFKIARYDGAEGGHFRAHRDNLSPATAHRRFAFTLNLNEGYEGGHLRFAEYAPHLYRPAAGGAIAFSCSLLHEALPVTRGLRYVLLSFLFGEDDVRASPPAEPK